MVFLILIFTFLSDFQNLHSEKILNEEKLIIKFQLIIGCFL